MIGNDIIDIAKAKTDSNWQRPRFLNKLFTENEQQIIFNSDDSFLTVWQLWSMKEAAYKLYTQIYPSRFYDPKGFECQINKSFSIENFGFVKFKNFKCYVETHTTSNYIISEATLKPLSFKSEVIQFQTENSTNQSIFLKQKLINSVSEVYNISKDKLNLKINKFGIPAINFNTSKIQVSLTHHGHFGAFVFSEDAVSSNFGIQ